MNELENKTAVETSAKEVQDTSSAEKTKNNTNNTSIIATKDYHFMCYLGVLLAFIVLFGIFLRSSHNSLIESQTKIIDSYSNLVSHTDSSVSSLIRYSNDYRKELNRYISTEIDSISTMVKNNNLPDVIGVLSRIEVNTQILRDENKIYSTIVTDSIMRSHEILLAKVQTEKMLELHLAKIEHEYTNITIWAAILTIVFIVFSFFSMFKLEEARKEAERILKETSEKAYIDISAIQDKTGSVYAAINAIDAKAQAFIDDKEGILNGIITNHEIKLNGLVELEKAIKEKATKSSSRKPKSTEK